MNSPILTSYGNYMYDAISTRDAIMLIGMEYGNFTSAIGHESTAKVISTILGIDVKFNRISVATKSGDRQVIFKLNQRAPEGKILSIEEINEIGYSWGLVTQK